MSCARHPPIANLMLPFSSVSVKIAAGQIARLARLAAMKELILTHTQRRARS